MLKWVIALVLMLVVACSPAPEQVVVGPTGAAIQEPSIIDDIPDPIPVEETPPSEPEPIEEPNPEPQDLPPEPADKLTALWAAQETDVFAKNWAEDARLFQIRGVNMIEGKITNNYYMVTDRRVFTSYFIVSYIADSLDNREIIDIRVDFTGTSGEFSRRFLPNSRLGAAAMAEVVVNSDEVADIMDDINQGWGYSLKSMEFDTAGYIKEELSLPGSEPLTIGNSQTSREEAYADIDDETPIALVETYFNVIYEINLQDGSVIGLREVRD